MIKESPWINFCVLFCLLSSIACSGTKSSPKTDVIVQQDFRSPAGIEPRAEQLLRKMGDAIRSKNHFAIEAEIVRDEVLESGQRVQFGKHSVAVVKRPNRLWARTEGDRVKGEIFYDGTRVSVLDTEAEHFAAIQAPNSIDEMLDFLVEDYGFLIPLADLLFSDPYSVLREEIHSGRYLGRSTVAGVECEHLAFRQKNIDWQLWVTTGEAPLPKKMVITYKQEPGIPQYAAVFSDSSFSKPKQPQAFRFVPSAQYEAIELLPITAVGVE